MVPVLGIHDESLQTKLYDEVLLSSAEPKSAGPKKDTDGCTQHTLHSTPLVVGLLVYSHFSPLS